MEIQKPRRLATGDTIAVVSTSWGGPHLFPHVFERGLDVLRQRFGLSIREMPTARMSPAALAADPLARAADLNAAFADPSIAGIIASIGGADSALILPHLDPDVIVANPKVLMGFSDTTTQLLFANRLGLVTFNGPSVMAGFAQLWNFPEAQSHIRSVLFEPSSTLRYEPAPAWTDGYVDWSAADNDGRVQPLRPHDGWHWVNGTGVHRGRLVGGCIEVLEFIRSSRFWPADEFWDGRILFLETSEEVPTIEQIRYWLFGHGVGGVFDRISALLVGRARGYSDADKAALDEAIRQVVVEQFGAPDLPIVTNMDFGHTDPQWVMPLGVMAEVDCDARTFGLVEPAVR